MSLTLTEVAKVLGISVQLVKYVEKKALEKLRHPRNIKKWEQILSTIEMIEEDRAKRVRFQSK